MNQNADEDEDALHAYDQDDDDDECALNNCVNDDNHEYAIDDCDSDDDAEDCAIGELSAQQAGKQTPETSESDSSGEDASGEKEMPMSQSVRSGKRKRQSADCDSSDEDSSNGQETPPTELQSDRSGRTKIYVDGYEYTRATITKVKITYRCSFYRSQKCPAKLAFIAGTVMDYDFENSIDHTCTPPFRPSLQDQAQSTTKDVTAAMQKDVDRMAISGTATPQHIWDTVSGMYFSGDGTTVIRGMSRAQVIKRIHRTRAVHFGADLHGRVEVPPLSRVKNSELNIFQFHHVWYSPKTKAKDKLDRVVGWAHPALLCLLRYENISLFLDGTFRCVPAKFKQCVVAMVYDRGTKLFVPVFYVLCTSKTHDTYWNALQFIGNACGDTIRPKSVVCDFEAALINAVTDWFPETQVIGCLFHFKQACKRRIVKYRIPPTEANIAMERGVLDMLTVIDPSKIVSHGFVYVKNKIRERCKEEAMKYSTHKWKQFWGYFERTWIQRFPPKFWNVFGIRRDIIARTNNPLERFNRELNAAFGTPHPSLPRFVQTIEQIARRHVQLRDDVSRGRAEPPRRGERYELPQAVLLSEAERHSDTESSEHDSAML